MLSTRRKPLRQRWRTEQKKLRASRLPHVLYHGTTQARVKSILKTGLRKGTYFSDLKEARVIASLRARKQGGVPAVIRVYGRQLVPEKVQASGLVSHKNKVRFQSSFFGRHPRRHRGLTPLHRADFVVAHRIRVTKRDVLH